MKPCTTCHSIKQQIMGNEISCNSITREKLVADAFGPFQPNAEILQYLEAVSEIKG